MTDCTSWDESITPLRALDELFRSLCERHVRFCHWKSNSHLAEAVRGETDLDILVDRDQAADFRRTLLEHDFKPLRAAPGKHYAGVENHLGFDVDTGRLLHLHVHYRLVLGQQFVKDHRLPIEHELLESVRLVGGVPIPSAAVELIVLAVRAVLKYRTRDALKDVFELRSGGIPPAIRAEARWLLEQTTNEEVTRTLGALGNVVPAPLVREIIAILTSEQAPGRRLLSLRRRLRRALRPMRTLSRPRATGRYARALIRKRSQASGLVRKRRMTPESGGLTVAFIGSDGAGKSTVVSEMRRWLSWRLDVATPYMGNAQRSPAGRLLKGASKLSRSAHRYVERTPPISSAARLTGPVSQLLLASRRVAEAHQRYRAYVASQDQASRGAVVLFDRYPLVSVPIGERNMDGPRLDEELSAPRSKLLEHLVNREKGLYDGIRPPEHVVALQVSPEVSLQRKPDHDPAAILAKTHAVRQSSNRENGFVDVDADRPLDQVVADVRARLWEWL